ncbi:MAG: group II intron reverse transcriptase/maturase [Methanomassiliicoccaceae archaeon]|nr:group II intron reverse transcriptase/maturase [Methanomassiliicoccaceae archaeon]
MKGNASTTSKDENIPNCYSNPTKWETIDWNKAEEHVNRLRTKIAEAYSEGKKNTTKRSQYLLVNSFYAKCLAVRKVTTNQGKHTPGVDGEIWYSSEMKMSKALQLTSDGYKAKPLRRVHIPKKNGKLRPLGIPTMYDRAMQALHAMALEPIAEVTADPNSYGFRKGRNQHDACGALFCALGKNTSAKWVLEGDIKGCFDNISHNWILKHIPMDKHVLKEFLKAGYMENNTLYPTEGGTPQGGIVSPILANMALDGMESMLEHNHRSERGKKSVEGHKNMNPRKVNLVRYADDFIITCDSRETAERLRKEVTEFLIERELTLSPEKTLVTNIDQGFDFLGWTFRKFKGKMIIKPSKESVKTVKEKIKTIVKRGLQWPQDLVIAQLNQTVIGWANYHRHIVAAEVFGHIDNYIFWTLARWARHRHRNKSWKWRKNRYWHTVGTRNWVFHGEKETLKLMSDVKIKRYVKVRAKTNPYSDREYYEERKSKKMPKEKSGWGLVNFQEEEAALIRTRFVILEPYEGKLSRTVQRREGGATL